MTLPWSTEPLFHKYNLLNLVLIIYQTCRLYSHINWISFWGTDHYYRDTLSDPDLVNIEASCERLHLLSPVGCLKMGADVAETINAKNSLEKMLAHQMAACHVLSMKFLSEARDQIDHLRPHHRSETAVKMTNASARLMDTFQRGLATLTKIRTGGQQKMIVEHIHINEGGQAIVGNVNSGGGGPQDESSDKKQW